MSVRDGNDGGNVGSATGPRTEFTADEHEQVYRADEERRTQRFLALAGLERAIRVTLAQADAGASSGTRTHPFWDKVNAALRDVEEASKG